MYRKIAVFTMVLAMAVCIVPLSSYANPGKPFFGPAIWADGMPYGSKATTLLPAPNDHNMQSYDPLYHVLTADNMGLLTSVAESTPGDRTYNGGRWIVLNVVWDVPAMAAPLYSVGEIDAVIQAGYAHIEETGVYVQCPLLPAK